MTPEKRMCPKCTADTITVEYQREWPPTVREWLALRCRTCGYSWTQPTADNTARFMQPSHEETGP